MTRESQGDMNKPQNAVSTFGPNLSNENTALEIESKMIQSRLLSPMINRMEELGLNQSQLAARTGMSQPFINALLNIRKKANVEHLAKFQKALGIVLQPPKALTEEEHYREFYDTEVYDNYEQVSSAKSNIGMRMEVKFVARSAYRKKRFNAPGISEMPPKNTQSEAI